MAANVQTPEFDGSLDDLLDHNVRVVAGSAGLGKRERADLVKTLEKAAARIGKAPPLTWAIDRLKKVKESPGS